MADRSVRLYSLHVRRYPRFQIPLTIVQAKHEKQEIPADRIELVDIGRGGAMLRWKIRGHPIRVCDRLELVLAAPAHLGCEVPPPRDPVTGKVVNLPQPVYGNQVSDGLAAGSADRDEKQSPCVNLQFDSTQEWVIPYALHFSPRPKGLWRVWQQHFPKSSVAMGTGTQLSYCREIEERICYVAGHQMASSAGITRLSLDRWLAQFRPPGEDEDREKAAYDMDCALLRLAEVILSHYYISSEKCQLRCKWLLRRLRQRLDQHNDQNAGDRIGLSDVLFLPIGKASKSGHLVQYLLRARGNIPAGLFEERGALPRISRSQDVVSWEQGTRIGKAKLLVFCDDFFGSGETAREEALRIRQELRTRGILKGKHIALYALAGTQVAVESLEKCFSSAHYLQDDHLFDVAVAEQPLGPRDLINNQTLELSHLAPTDLEIIRRLCIHNKTLFRDHMGEPRPFGYGDVGSLVVFEHNTPNNTLPILWAESTRRRPLFHRHATPEFVPGAHPVVRTFEQMAWRAKFFKELEANLGKNQTILIWGEAGVGKASAVIAWFGKAERSERYYKSPGVVGSRLIWHDVLSAYTEDIFLNSVAGFLSARGYPALSLKTEHQFTWEYTVSKLFDEEVCKRLQDERAVVCFNGISHIDRGHVSKSLNTKDTEQPGCSHEFVLTVADKLKGIVPVLLLFDTRGTDLQGLNSWAEHMDSRQIPYDMIEVKRPGKEQLEDVIDHELNAQHHAIEKGNVPGIPDICKVMTVGGLAQHLSIEKLALLDELWRITSGHPLAMALAIGALQNGVAFSSLQDMAATSEENPCEGVAQAYLDSLPQCDRELILGAAVFEEPRCRDALRIITKQTDDGAWRSEDPKDTLLDISFDVRLARLALLHKAFLVQLPDNRYGMTDTIRTILLRIFRKTDPKRLEELNRTAAYYYASLEDVRYSSRVHNLAVAFQHLLCANSRQGFAEAAELLEQNADEFIRTGHLRKLDEMICRGMIAARKARESKLLTEGYIGQKGTYEDCISKICMVLNKLCRCTTQHGRQENLFEEFRSIDKDLSGSLNKVRLYRAGALASRWALDQAIGEIDDAKDVLQHEAMLSPNTSLLKAKVLLRRCQILTSMNQYQSAWETLYEAAEVIDWLRVNGSPRCWHELAVASRHASTLLFLEGLYEQAFTFANTTKQLAEEADDAEGCAIASHRLGMIWLALEEYQQAQRCMESALMYLHKVCPHSRWWAVVMHNGLAHVESQRLLHSPAVEPGLEPSWEQAVGVHLKDADDIIEAIRKEEANCNSSSKRLRACVKSG